MKSTRLLIPLCLLFCFAAKANPADTTIEKRKYFTKRLNGNITLDGIPNEDAWSAVEWSGNFTQISPYEKHAPSQPSNFKILYDNNFLYIGYDCVDASPDSISKRMARRDEFPGDWIEVNIDSYHDLRSGFFFYTIGIGCTR